MLIEFCLPIYNEEKILKKNLLFLLDYLKKQDFSFDWKIVLIINGSSDNSLQIAQEVSRAYSSKISFYNIIEKGKGIAFKKYFFQSRADIICYMDIDLAVSLDCLPGLLNPLISKQKDLVFGSRLLPDSQINRSFLRGLSSQIYNFLSRLILNHKFSDLQCGFKAFKVEKFKEINSFLRNNKWFFDTEFIIWSKQKGFKIEEIPVNRHEKRYDQRKSKVSLVKDSLIFLRNLLILRKKIKNYN